DGGVAVPASSAVATTVAASAGPTGTGAEPADARTRTDRGTARASAASTPPTTGPTTDAPVRRRSERDERTGEATGPLASADVDLDTSKGRVEIGSAEVPDAAADFPLPDDLVVLLASETSSDAGFTGESELDVDTLAAFYESALPGAGYEIVSVQATPGVFAVFGFEDAETVGQVAISNAATTAGSSVIVAIGDGAGTETSLPD
ncbi:MAG: hypothetical protein QNJ12_11090, partial [Ilumatobacter sp.]|uniref:hypothetical protein n=1 Tax=Ilumatobacter sp. TaxID=1967498 RepID=UPI002613CE9C